MEAIVTFAILSGLLVLVFGSIGMTTSLFQDTQVRQGAENQLRAIRLLLQRDLELTDYWTVGLVARATPNGDRDALSAATVTDWNQTTSFDPATDRPIWTRYLVWYATQEPLAKLYRQVVEPGAGVAGAYGGLSTNISDFDPTGNANVLFTRTLSEKIENFKVTPRLQNGTVEVAVRLIAEGSQRPNSNVLTKEHLELRMVFQPRNTFPRI